MQKFAFFSVLMSPTYQLILHGSCFWYYILKKKRSASGSPMLFSRIFVVICFNFWTVIIWVNFCESVYFYLHMSVQLFQNHLLKRLTFLFSISFAPFLKISCLYLWESIQYYELLKLCALYSVPLIYFSTLLPFWTVLIILSL